MKIIETKVFEFNELNDKAKERAREWFKEGNCNDNNWNEWVIEDATIIASFMGIDIENIYFSGFWSQGDGACFVGKFRANDVKFGKVKEYAPNDENLNKIALEFESLALNYKGMWFKTTHTGRYSHENSVSFDFERLNEEGEHLPFNHDVEEEFKDVSKRFMKWIYSKLEEAYDYENSDKVVEENIKSNEYTFTESGKRFGN